MFLIQRVGQIGPYLDVVRRHLWLLFEEGGRKSVSKHFRIIFTEKPEKSYVIRWFICFLGRTAVFRTRKIATVSEEREKKNLFFYRFTVLPGSYRFYEVPLRDSDYDMHARGFIRRAIKFHWFYTHIFSRLGISIFRESAPLLRFLFYFIFVPLKVGWDDPALWMTTIWRSEKCILSTQFGE